MNNSHSLWNDNEKSENQISFRNFFVNTNRPARNINEKMFLNLSFNVVERKFFFRLTSRSKCAINNVIAFHDFIINWDESAVYQFMKSSEFMLLSSVFDLYLLRRFSFCHRQHSFPSANRMKFCGKRFLNQSRLHFFVCNIYRFINGKASKNDYFKFILVFIRT